MRPARGGLIWMARAEYSLPPALFILYAAAAVGVGGIAVLIHEALVPRRLRKVVMWKYYGFTCLRLYRDTCRGFGWAFGLWGDWRQLPRAGYPWGATLHFSGGGAEGGGAHSLED